MEFETLLNDLKISENDLTSHSAINMFEEKLNTLKTYNHESHNKTIHKFEEKLDYAKVCLNNKGLKEAVIEELKQVSELENLNESITQANQLKHQFLNIGYAGKNTDELLSRQFNELLFNVNEKRASLRLQKQAEFNANASLKERLIEQLNNVLSSDDMRKASNKVDEIFDNWKKIGYAGKEKEEQLWKKFNDLRHTFFKNRKEFYKKQDQLKAENKKIKLAIIEEVKAIVDLEDYSNEKAVIMKQFDVKWREAGYSLDNDALWETFNTTKQMFWDKRKVLSDAKQAEFKGLLTEIITKKTTQIENLQAQVLHLREKIGSVRNDEQLTKMQGWIKEKEEIIDKLVKEIDGMKQKIGA